MKFLAFLALSTILFLPKLAPAAAPLQSGEVYSFCDVVVYDTTKVSKSDVIHSLLDPFSGQLNSSAEAGVEIDLADALNAVTAKMAAPDHSDSKYSIRVTNDPSTRLKKIEILNDKGETLLLDQDTDAHDTHNDWKEATLSDGKSYIKTCATNIGQ